MQIVLQEIGVLNNSEMLNTIDRARLKLVNSIIGEDYKCCGVKK